MIDLKVHYTSDCILGEGPLWHPIRNELLWLDILAKRLYIGTSSVESRTLPLMVSAAGWIDADHLLLASEQGLLRYSLSTHTHELICAVEDDNPQTRSNDGRADPWGGFWFGTMGKNAEPAMGNIYRYYQGTLRKLFGDITISNALCFSPDRRFAYYTDTPTKTIQRVDLDAQGWPSGTPQPHITFEYENWNPDGAVVDSNGYIWIAVWGAGLVAGFDPNGRLSATLQAPSDHLSCPAFGGKDYHTMYVTSAQHELSPDQLASQPLGPYSPLGYPQRDKLNQESCCEATTRLLLLSGTLARVALDSRR